MTTPTHAPTTRALWPVTALALLVVSGCDLDTIHDEFDDPDDIVEAESPGASERTNSELVVELAPLADPETAEASQCGGSLEFQGVESYDGSLGPSEDFVDIHQRPVARLRWANDLGARYDDYDNWAGRAFCTGTLVSDDLLLTAGHCISRIKFDTFGGGTPTYDEVTAEIVVEFNYQNQANGTPRSPVTYTVDALLERKEWSGLDVFDYAVLRLNHKPGLRWGHTKLAYGPPAVNSTLTIIQHPAGDPKVVDAGGFDGIAWADDELEMVAIYNDIDTLGGSSGAGVLDSSGRIMGVHVGGDCNGSFGFNVAEPIDELVGVSDVLDDLLWGDIPLVGDIDGGGDDIVIYRPTNHRWYALHDDGTHVFPVEDEPAWGAGGDVPMLGDLDGDGLDEMIQWRPSTGKWYALRANGARFFPQGTEPSWGSPDATPLLGDLDGDGEDEMIVFEPLDRKWYALRADGSTVFPVNGEPTWGTRDDVPLVGDLDGDGADEIIMWRTSSYRWYAKRADGTLVFAQGAEPSWGTRGDVPMIANFDSIGGDDMVIWRPSTGKWYAKRADGTRVFPPGTEPVFGVDGDVPLVGNFNGFGDDDDDMAFWRPSTARWSGRTFWGVSLFSNLPWGYAY